MLSYEVAALSNWFFTSACLQSLFNTICMAPSLTYERQGAAHWIGWARRKKFMHDMWLTIAPAAHIKPSVQANMGDQLSPDGLWQTDAFTAKVIQWDEA